MSRKATAILLLVAGLLGMTGGFASIAWGASRIFRSFETIATFEAPGSATFTAERPGKITLWHDHQTLHQGMTVSHPRALPSGFAFELIHPVQGAKPMTSPGKGTMTTGGISRIAVGSFEIPEAGEYEIRVDGPESRFFSVTEGDLMTHLRGFFGGMGFGMFGIMLGFLLMVTGVILLIVAKGHPQPPCA